MPPIYVGVRPTAIAVQSPYVAQVQLLRDMLDELPEAAGVEVSTIDSFQGREADAVVISMVFSSNTYNVTLTIIAQLFIDVFDFFHIFFFLIGYSFDFNLAICCLYSIYIYIVLATIKACSCFVSGSVKHSRSSWVPRR